MEGNGLSGTFLEQERRALVGLDLFERVAIHFTDARYMELSQLETAIEYGELDPS